MNEPNVENKVVIVTGGASGLGAAISCFLARAGAVPVVAELNEDGAAALSRTLEAEGNKSTALRLDVGAEPSVIQAIEQVIAMHGRLDAVVNNAGIDFTRPIEELTVAEWERVIRTNLHGPFLMTKYALPHLRKAQGGGHIVNIASTASCRTWPNASAYHASKWGLLGFSRAMHSELRSRQVKVTTVIAGGMQTPFLLDRFPDIEVTTLQPPEDVARAVLFALSAPPESVIAEIMALPMKETSWP